MSLEIRTSMYPRTSVVDLFCGAGGLTCGLLAEGLRVVAGIDIDPICRYPYEHNNKGAEFYEADVAGIDTATVGKFYPKGDRKVLVGCAPCQPFSKYTQGRSSSFDGKWELLSSFGRIATELRPEVVSMENVPELKRHGVYEEFELMLLKAGYHVAEPAIVYCPDYGLPQQRTRLVLFASRLGPISIIPKKRTSDQYQTVRHAIEGRDPLAAGEKSAGDRLHRSAKLSRINLERVRVSKPGGTWRDWPENLVAECHRRKQGQTYPAVYGRMEWDEPSPTITTQFYGFGNGRFGHPDQARALSLREGAILQSFPDDYEFTEPNAEIFFSRVGRLIGNAVPVILGRVVGETIRRHLELYAG